MTGLFAAINPGSGLQCTLSWSAVIKVLGCCNCRVMSKAQTSSWVSRMNEYWKQIVLFSINYSNILVCMSWSFGIWREYTMQATVSRNSLYSLLTSLTFWLFPDMNYFISEHEIVEISEKQFSQIRLEWHWTNTEPSVRKQNRIRAPRWMSAPRHTARQVT